MGLAAQTGADVGRGLPGPLLFLSSPRRLHLRHLSLPSRNPQHKLSLKDWTTLLRLVQSLWPPVVQLQVQPLPQGQVQGALPQVQVQVQVQVQPLQQGATPATTSQADTCAEAGYALVVLDASPGLDRKTISPSWKWGGAGRPPAG